MGVRPPAAPSTTPADPGRHRPADRRHHHARSPMPATPAMSSTSSASRPRRLLRSERRLLRFHLRPRHRVRDARLRPLPHALVIGAEKLSSVVDWQDRTTCVLFGDGAGAVVIGPARARFADSSAPASHLPGASSDLLCIPRRQPVSGSTRESIAGPRPLHPDEGQGSLQTRGARDGRSRPGYFGTTSPAGGSDSLVIPHQANLRIIEAISDYLELPMERFSSTSIATATRRPPPSPSPRRSPRTGRIRSGDLVLLVAFGAGLTYGSAPDSLVTLFRCFPFCLARCLPS
jgi:hypothetical protein